MAIESGESERVREDRQEARRRASWMERQTGEGVSNDYGRRIDRVPVGTGRKHRPSKAQQRLDVSVPKLVDDGECGPVERRADDGLAGMGIEAK
jgi:hypothetical protein